MNADLKHHFPFSNTCYFDLDANTIADSSDGIQVAYIPISGEERIVLRKLIEDYPKAVHKDQLCKLVGGMCGEERIRKIINKLKKRHDCLKKWLPRASQGEYRLQNPDRPEQAVQSVSQHVPEQTTTLKSTGICVRPNFVKEARSDIFDQLDAAFAESHVVFLQGIGGIGKSETAKHWALQKKKERLFDTVVFAQLNAETSNSNIQALISDDSIFVLGGAFHSRDDNETAEAYFRRKLARIKQVTDHRTLIILDNYDIDDREVVELFTGPYCLLVTTRNKQKGYDFPFIALSEIHDLNHLKQIFFKNLDGEREDIQWSDPFIEKLFSLVSNHTLAVEIIAKSLINSLDTPEELFIKICDPDSHALIRNADGAVDQYFSEEPCSPLECIRMLFNLSRLENDSDFDCKTQVLAFMAAMPTKGIELSLFNKWSDNRIIRAKNSLVRKSWLRQESVKGTAFVSMHPLIREVVWKDLEPSLEKCSALVDRFIQEDREYLDRLYHQPKSSKDEYEQIALSLLSAFPIQSLINFDFYEKILRILHICKTPDIPLRLALKMKELLEQENQMATWHYAFVNSRIGAIYSYQYRDQDAGMDFFLKAENLMRTTASTNTDRMWLAILYREIVNATCLDQYLFILQKPIPIASIESWLDQGEAIATDLCKEGFINTNLDIYYGTIYVWRSRLAIYRGEIDLAAHLIDLAESEFIRHAYVNALDKVAIADTRAQIHAAKGEYAEEIKYLRNSIKINLGGFGEYNRSSVERAIKLATAYINNGQPAEAIDVLTYYQKIAEEMLGEDAPLTVTIRSMLTQLHQTADSGN